VMGPVFLTGLVTNFLIIGLLPPAEQARFDWIGWLIAAAPAALVLFLGSATILFALHRRSGSRASSNVRRSQEQALGRLSRQELVSLLALGVFVAGLALQGLLRLVLGVVGLGAPVVPVGGGALVRQFFCRG